MKTLPLKIRKNCFNYVQVRRGRRSFIYRQEVSPNLNYFEVFRIHTKPERTILGKRIEAKEIFPPDKVFGQWAWSFKNFESAIKKFNEIENEKDMVSGCK